jgi:hypothetical protein
MRYAFGEVQFLYGSFELSWTRGWCYAYRFDCRRTTGRTTLACVDVVIDDSRRLR